MKISSALFAAIVCVLLTTLGCGGTASSSPALGNNLAGGSNQTAGSPSAPATNTAPGSIPTPPAQAVSFQKLQTSSDWNSCNITSCAGGSGAGAYWIAQNQTTPSLSGSSMELDNSGVWGNALWFNKLGPQPEASNFLWNFDFQVDDASLKAAQALEFDAFQFLGGYNYMMGTECNYASGFWDLWDAADGHWKRSAVPCSQFQPNVWHHITLFTERSTTGTGYTFVTLSVDGTSYALNQSYSAQNNGWDGQIGVQYQLDVNASGAAYQEWVDNVTLAAW